MTQATDYDKVSSAYASALVELAQEKNALDTVHADVDSLQVRSGPRAGEWAGPCCSFFFSAQCVTGKLAATGGSRAACVLVACESA